MLHIIAHEWLGVVKVIGRVTAFLVLEDSWQTPIVEGYDACLEKLGSDYFMIFYRVSNCD